MKRTKRKAAPLSLAALLATLAIAPPALAAYRIVDLGVLGGYLSEATSCNHRGLVVGGSDAATPGQFHAFLWSDGTMTDLAPLLGEDLPSWAFGINDRGQIVGVHPVTDSQGEPVGHAYLLQNSIVTDLGTLGGRSSQAVGISENGSIVGTSDLASGRHHAFLWKDGTMADLGTLGGYDSHGSGINNKGQVVGYSMTGTTGITAHAFLWQDGAMTDLGTLGGRLSNASAINDRGQIVGTANTAAGAVHAFLWQNGTMTDLGTLGGSNSGALGINGRGQVVGSSEIADGTSHAFLWQDGTMTDLGTLGGGNSNANMIDEGGRIAGSADLGSGVEHAVIWETAGGAGTGVSANSRGARTAPGPATESVSIMKGSAVATLSLRLPSTGMAEIQLFDVQGRLHLRRSVEGAPGERIGASLNLGGLPSGIYWIRSVGANGAGGKAMKVALVR